MWSSANSDGVRASGAAEAAREQGLTGSDGGFFSSERTTASNADCLKLARSAAPARSALEPGENLFLERFDERRERPVVVQRIEPRIAAPSMPTLPETARQHRVPMRAASAITLAPPSMTELTTSTWLLAIHERAAVRHAADTAAKDSLAMSRFASPESVSPRRRLHDFDGRREDARAQVRRGRTLTSRRWPTTATGTVGRRMLAQEVSVDW
jgi:hypothetical protein